VIENKVFCLPDRGQLERYTKEITKRVRNPALWLLSLSNPNWEDDRQEIALHEWRWLSYRKLAELIRSALPTDNPSYEVDQMRHYSIETMRHYAKVIDLLHKLAANVEVKDSKETAWLSDDVIAALPPSPLPPSMAKLCASSIERHIRKALGEAGVSQKNVETGWGHSPYIEWFSPLIDDWQAGWQLEKFDFRLALRVHKNNETMKVKKQRENFANAHHKEFFNFSDLDDKLDSVGKPIQPRRIEFSSYEPSRSSASETGRSYAYVYKYKQIPNLTVSQLEAAAVAVAGRAIFKLANR
jgi:hypothetical protein